MQTGDIRHLHVQDFITCEDLPQKNAFLVVSHVRNQCQTLGRVPAGDNSEGGKRISCQMSKGG